MNTKITATEVHNIEEIKLMRLKQEAYAMLSAAEKAWYAYFCEAPVGREREWAADVYENVRCATRT